MWRNRQWEMAAAMPVTTLAMLTVPETVAGLRPAPSNMLELVGPKPIPSAPSTSEAQNPARATSNSSSIDGFSYRFRNTEGFAPGRASQCFTAGAFLREVGLQWAHP